MCLGGLFLGGIAKVGSGCAIDRDRALEMRDIFLDELMRVIWLITMHRSELPRPESVLVLWLAEIFFGEI